MDGGTEGTESDRTKRKRLRMRGDDKGGGKMSPTVPPGLFPSLNGPSSSEPLTLISSRKMSTRPPFPSPTGFRRGWGGPETGIRSSRPMSVGCLSVSGPVRCGCRRYGECPTSIFCGFLDSSGTFRIHYRTTSSATRRLTWRVRSSFMCAREGVVGKPTVRLVGE